jgi:hypothetical protein
MAGSRSQARITYHADEAPPLTNEAGTDSAGESLNYCARHPLTAMLA